MILKDNCCLFVHYVLYLFDFFYFFEEYPSITLLFFVLVS